VSSIFAELKLCGKIDLLQIIINLFAYVAGHEDTNLTDSVSSDFSLHKRQIGLVDFFENAALSDCSI
jgi:hypothetical protein